MFPIIVASHCNRLLDPRLGEAPLVITFGGGGVLSASRAVTVAAASFHYYQHCLITVNRGDSDNSENRL